MSSRNEINIVLLGETGVGKSTFINAFANYMIYDTLNNAKFGKIVCFIPAKFTVTDDNFDEHEVKFGQDKNESNVDGQSATQGCKAYVFELGDLTVRLIDTPGVGDTRGVEKDRQNFDNILSFISNYEYIHAFCILLKPNNARVSVMFEFCIKQLLVHLEKSASKNIAFLFTNARGTFYKPGDTAKPLKEILKNLKDVKIEFNQDTVYCFDNEAFRFLVALKSGVKFQEDDKIWEASWEKSVAECMRLIFHIVGGKNEHGLPPHKVKDTISVNEARRMIVSLSKPLADITQFIQSKKELLEDRIKLIAKTDGDIEKLKKSLTYIDVELQKTDLSHPMTVCGNINCAGIREIAGRKVLLYEKKCHNPCGLSGIVRDIMGPGELMSCWAMNGEYCRICSHSYREHLHIYYLVNIKQVTRIDSSVKDDITTKEKAKEFAKEKMKIWQKEMDDYQKEMEFITKATAKFAHFLKNNAIAPYNDSFENYLKHLIENKRILLDGEKGTDAEHLIDGLQRMLNAYIEEKKQLDDAIESGNKETASVSTTDIFDTIAKLYTLPKNGKDIKNLMTSQERTKLTSLDEHNEVVVKDPTQKGIVEKFKNGLNYFKKKIY